MGDTWGTLRLEIQRNLGGRDDDDTLAANLANANHVQKTLAQLHRFEELEERVSPVLTIAQGVYTQAELDLTALRKIYSFRLIQGTTSYPVTYMTPARWDERIEPQVPNATSGRPYIYTMWGGNIYFWYIPDETYTCTLRYFKYLTAITNDASEFAIADVNDTFVHAVTSLTAYTFEEFALGDKHAKLASSAMSLFGMEDEIIENFVAGLRPKALSAQAYDYYNNPFIKEMP
jgi:hypothetical protein